MILRLCIVCFVIIKKSGSRLRMSSRGSVSFLFVLSHIHLNRIYRDGKKYEAIFSEAKDKFAADQSADTEEPVPRASATDFDSWEPSLLRDQRGDGQALSAESPVVALESTVIAHGLPQPQNLETARRLEQII